MKEFMDNNLDNNNKTENVNGNYKKILVSIMILATAIICFTVSFTDMDTIGKTVLFMVTIVTMGLSGTILFVLSPKAAGINKSREVPENNNTAAVIVNNTVPAKPEKTVEDNTPDNNVLKKKIPLSDITILCVDDTALNLKLITGIFAKTDIKLHTANSGKTALEMAAENKYDLILLDHMMPEMSGLETFEHLRSKKDGINYSTPVIALTANSSEGAEEDYIQRGFAGYIGKPVKKDKLFTSISNVLGIEINPEEAKKETANADKVNTDKEQEKSSEKTVNVTEKDTTKQQDNNKEQDNNQHQVDKTEHEHTDTNSDSSVIEKLIFLDTAEGIRNCNGEEELFVVAVNEFLKTERTKEMSIFFEKEDWNNYEIVVHALKSTSKLIGCEDLFKEAKALEEACKEKNIDYVKDKHGPCLADYIQLLEMIDRVAHGHEIGDSVCEMDISSKYLVYVTDDDESNRMIVSNILQQQFDVVAFKSGEELIQGIENKIPNLVILDIFMDGMSGFDVVEKLHSNENWREIPVIFLTSEDDSSAEIKGFKSGAMDFIKKPVVAEIMLERINRIIELIQLRKYLENEVTRKTGKVERLSLQALQTLAQTIDAKDKYTNGHSNRVASYSKELSRRLGFSAEDQKTIYYMGLLHDIGKIGIPDTIINKDGKLTDEEFGMIKKHPEIGYSILKNITEIPDIEKGARWHHERYDGRGYPDGLSGKDIPLFARIIAVADSYDAMTSFRSYRDVLPQDFVYGEIEKGKGSQFDPEVADLMLQLIKEDKDYDMREKKAVK